MSAYLGPTNARQVQGIVQGDIQERLRQDCEKEDHGQEIDDAEEEAARTTAGAVAASLVSLASGHQLVINFLFGFGEVVPVNAYPDLLTSEGHTLRRPIPSDDEASPAISWAAPATDRLGPPFGDPRSGGTFW